MSKFLRLLFLSSLLLVLLACRVLGRVSPVAVTSLPAVEIPTFTATPTVTSEPPVSSLFPIFTATATATAVLPSPIPPTASPSPTATQNCDQAQFITDVTIPDGTVLNPGERFTKTWRLKNTGSCAWTSSYAVVFVSGTPMSGPAVQALPGNVNPGQAVDISVNLTAPTSSGNYTAYWKLRNAAGVTFAQFYVQIKVREVVDVPGSAPFAVIHVTYDVFTFNDGGYVGCPGVVAHITTNGPGVVTYRWARSDGGTGSLETLHFSAAGTQNVETKWYLGSAAGPQWLGIYIDEPNHQDFSHVAVNPCTSP